MADTKLLEKWFDKIDGDLCFLVDCFAEVLEELGEAEVAQALPWRSDFDDVKLATAPSSDEVERELQVLSIAYHLLNIVEENAAAQARRQRENKFGVLHEPGLWGNGLRKLMDDGYSVDHIARALQNFAVEIVLTAHPTEAKRPPVLRQHRALFKEQSRLEYPHWTDSERESIRDRIKVILERLWRTGEMYLEKPDVLSELDHILDYFLIIFPPAISTLRQRLADAWEKAELPLDKLPDAFPGPTLKFGNWIGGDRDGHPLVTPETTRVTLDRMRRNALEIVQERLEQLMDNMTLSDLFQDPPGILLDAIEAHAKAAPNVNAKALPFAHEPWRQFVFLLLQKLERSATPGKSGYSRPESLAADLKLLGESLNAVGAHRLAKSEIDPLIAHLNVFGFHLAALDIRQNSDYHANAVSQMLCAAGIEDCDFASWDADKQCAFLKKELTSLRPLVPRNSELGEEATNVLGYFKVIAEHINEFGPEGIGRFIVSMTRSNSDLLVMYLFAREVGLLHMEDGEIRCQIAIVPLFETLSDLDAGAGIMKEFFAFPIAQNTLRQTNNHTPTQEVMVGYSDSNKDAGIFASQWALHRAQQALGDVGREHNIDIAFFHGRGGTFSRGAGPIHRFLESLPGGSLQSLIRMTEQGEVISQKFGNLPTAVFNLELLLAGATVAAVEHQKRQELDQRCQNICSRLSDWSSESYRALLADADFLEFWTFATPIDALELSFIGSRPTRRKGQRTIEDLRAIPWVFSWTQARFYLTGWYGVGSALKKLKDESPEDFAYIKERRSIFSFVQYVLNNAETSLASADTDVMAQYAEMVPDAGIREEQLARIVEEHERTTVMLDDFFDAKRDLRRPRLVKTLDMRAAGLRRLHTRQIQLLQEWRELIAADKTDEAAELFPLVLLSINAIAGAERTTG